MGLQSSLVRTQCGILGSHCARGGTRLYSGIASRTCLSAIRNIRNPGKSSDLRMTIVRFLVATGPLTSQMAWRHVQALAPRPTPWGGTRLDYIPNLLVHNPDTREIKEPVGLQLSLSGSPGPRHPRWDCKLRLCGPIAESQTIKTPGAELDRFASLTCWNTTWYPGESWHLWKFMDTFW